MAKSKDIIVKNGAIDIRSIAEEAQKKVDRAGGVPVHACGAQDYRDCPC